jgi:hypothetical protein
VSHPQAGIAQRKYGRSAEKPIRCKRDYRFGNEDQNKLLATALKLSEQICLQARMKANRRMYVGRANFIMILLSIMAHQAYACATLWTCGAEMSLAMCRCINSSMEAYLGALEETHGAVKVSAPFAASAEHARSADVIPFPIHKTNSSRPR